MDAHEVNAMRRTNALSRELVIHAPVEDELLELELEAVGHVAHCDSELAYATASARVRFTCTAFWNTWFERVAICTHVACSSFSFIHWSIVGGGDG